MKKQHFLLKKFEYLTGLSADQFNILMECVRPFINILLVYDSNRKPTERTFSYETQYLIVLVICRYGLDLKFVAYMTIVTVSIYERPAYRQKLNYTTYNIVSKVSGSTYEIFCIQGRFLSEGGVVFFGSTYNIIFE